MNTEDPKIKEIELHVKDMFDYHAWDAEQIRLGQLIRVSLASACELIYMYVPDCPDRDTAIRKLREVRMDCNSAITHNGKY